MHAAAPCAARTAELLCGDLVSQGWTLIAAVHGVATHLLTHLRITSVCSLQVIPSFDDLVDEEAAEAAAEAEAGARAAGGSEEEVQQAREAAAAAVKARAVAAEQPAAAAADEL